MRQAINQPHLATVVGGYVLFPVPGCLMTIWFQGEVSDSARLGHLHGVGLNALVDLFAIHGYLSGGREAETNLGALYSEHGEGYLVADPY